MIPQSNIWHSPANGFNHSLKIAKNLGADGIKKARLENKIFETQTVAALCLGLYKLHGTPYFFQLAKKDPPDAFITSYPDSNGNLNIGAIEVTSYVRNNGKLPKLGLLDQLKATKTFENFHKYGEHDLVLVHVGIGLPINTQEVISYLKTIEAPYQLWFIQEASNYPDTIAELTLCYPISEKVRLNIGEAALEYKQNRIPGTLVAKKTGDINSVGTGYSSQQIVEAPWATEGMFL